MYKSLSFIGAVVFAVCGIFFLIFPNSAYQFFNSVSISLGMQSAPEAEIGFFYIYFIGYFYLTAVLAFLMYRNPENRHFPVLLAHCSYAVSVLSITLFLIRKPYLIYIVSLVANVIIGTLALTGSAKINKFKKNGHSLKGNGTNPSPESQ